MSVSLIKRNIRRALEGPLKPALIAEEIFGFDGVTPAIHWPGIAIKETNRPDQLLKIALPRKPAYVRVDPPSWVRTVIEMGDTPRVEGNGHIKFGCFTAAQFGDDLNDRLAGIVESAYPYNANLEFDGVGVTIWTVDQGQPVTVDGWRYCPVKVNWTCWRT